VAASHSADLVSLGRPGPAPAAQDRLGRTVRDVLAARGRVLILARSPVFRGGAVALVHGDSEAGRAAREIALHLAERTKSGLVVISLATETAAAQRAVGDLLAEREIAVDFTRAATRQAVAEVARQRGARLVVAPADHQALDEDMERRHLLDLLSCPLMLVAR
jgi:hypothetical protein